MPFHLALADLEVDAAHGLDGFAARLVSSLEAVRLDHQFTHFIPVFGQCTTCFRQRRLDGACAVINLTI